MNNWFKNLKIQRRIIAIFAALNLYGDPGKDFKIIGVTGTNGKTTVSTLLYKTFLELGYSSGLIGTLGTFANKKEIAISRKIPTTPDPLTLRKIFTEFKKEGVAYVFMEISSHAMDQGRVSGITFTGGVFTNLTQDHLDYHKNMRNYFLAKKKFFKSLPKNSFALTNNDDPFGISMIEKISAKKYTYGFSGGENFHGKLLKNDFSGIDVQCNKNFLCTQLLGTFNAYNLIAVYGVCNLLHFPENKLIPILNNLQSPVGRFEVLKKNDITIIIDYAHTPDALEKILLTITDLKEEGSKIISVFGCGGDRDSTKRPLMGQLGVALSDIAILTSDNPRSENPEKILQEMTTNLSQQEIQKVILIADRRQAIQESLKIAKSGDVILCAGKGHETYQEIMGVKHHFNDKEEYLRSM